MVTEWILYSRKSYNYDKTDEDQYTDDDRIIPSSPIDYGAVRSLRNYGDFQAECGGASFIANNLMLVPSVGVATVGFGTTNGGIIPSSFLPGGIIDTYLRLVSILTYARGLVDIGVGTASTYDELSYVHSYHH